MADCTPTPTATLFRTTVRTDSSLVVVTSQSVGTAPPRTRTITQSSCTSSVGDVCLGYSTTEVVTVIPGSETTRDVLVTSYDIVTAADVVPTTTLYAGCEASNTDPVSDPASTPVSSSSAVNSSGNGNTNNNGNAANSSKGGQAEASAAQSAVSTDSSMMSGMSVYTSIVYVTMPDGAVSSSATVATTTPTLWANGDFNNHDSGPSGGVIAGAVVGTLVGVGLLGCFLFLFWKRRRRWEVDNFDERSDHSGPVTRKRSMNLLDEEPKPYQYGVVGAQTPPSSATKNGFSHTHARSVPNLYNPSLMSSQSLDLSTTHSHSPLYNPNPSPSTISRPSSRSSRPKSLGALPKIDSSSLNIPSTRTSAEEAVKSDTISETGEKSGSSFVVVRKPRSQAQVVSNPNNGQQQSSIPPVPPLPTQKKPPAPAPQPDYFADLQMSALSGGLRLALTNPDIISDNDP